MTYIRVDPDELTSIAGTWNRAASSTSEVCSGLTSCVHCALPPELSGMVGQVLASADRILQSVLTQLISEVNDLTNRAAVASSDAALAGASTGPALGTPSFGGSVVGGSVIDGSVIGGSGFSSAVATSSSVAAGGLIGGGLAAGTTIAGGFTSGGLVGGRFDNPSPTLGPNLAGTGTMILGNTSPYPEEGGPGTFTSNGIVFKTGATGWYTPINPGVDSNLPAGTNFPPGGRVTGYTGLRTNADVIARAMATSMGG